MAQTNFRIRWRANEVDPRYIPTPTRLDPAFEFTIINDDVMEPPGREYFEIDLRLNTGATRNGFFFPNAVGRVTIIDDDIRKFLDMKPFTARVVMGYRRNQLLSVCTYNSG